MAAARNKLEARRVKKVQPLKTKINGIQQKEFAAAKILLLTAATTTQFRETDGRKDPRYMERNWRCSE